MSFHIQVFARDDDNVYVEFHREAGGQKIVDFTLGPDGAEWFAQALTEKAAAVRAITENRST